MSEQDKLFNNELFRKAVIDELKALDSPELADYFTSLHFEHDKVTQDVWVEPDYGNSYFGPVEHVQISIFVDAKTKHILKNNLDKLECAFLDSLPPYLSEYRILIRFYSNQYIGYIHNFDILSDSESFITDITANIHINLPADLLEKGKEMAGHYLIIFHLENALRTFITEVVKKAYDKADESAMLPLLSTDLKNKYHNRKASELKNSWLSVNRGDSPIFYLDLEDLGIFIKNNHKTIFDGLFPDDNFIKNKVDEIGRIRNLIAHNSYINQDDINLVREYYKQIAKQIGAHKTPVVTNPSPNEQQNEVKPPLPSTPPAPAYEDDDLPF